MSNGSMLAQVGEIRERMVRLETRFTAYMSDQGFNTRAEKVRWDAGVVRAPSQKCSLKECLDAIPNDWLGEPIPIVVHKDVIGYIQKPDI